MESSVVVCKISSLLYAVWLDRTVKWWYVIGIEHVTSADWILLELLLYMQNRFTAVWASGDFLRWIRMLWTLFYHEIKGSSPHLEFVNSQGLIRCKIDVEVLTFLLGDHAIDDNSPEVLFCFMIVFALKCFSRWSAAYLRWLSNEFNCWIFIL